jgi:HAD superfamily, subfamily IIIB (Acid phosphatase)
MTINCYVFDIDGTVADLSHRLHHITGEKRDDRAFFAACAKDEPISHILGLAGDLVRAGRQIVWVSSRSDECRDQTIDWLKSHNAPAWPLYMRKADDDRPDNIVKGELLDQLMADGFNPLMAFDDRDRVVKMWRARGIPCAQVAEGDF